MVVSFRPTSHGWLVEKTQRRTAEKRKPKEFNLFKQLDKVGLIISFTDSIFPRLSLPARSASPGHSVHVRHAPFLCA